LEYRNGVKPWQFDPTKWLIWTLSKLGLARKLRRVPEEKVALAELAEAQRRLEQWLAQPELTNVNVVNACKHEARLPLRRCSFLPRRFAQRRRLDLFPGRTVRAFLVTPPEGAVVGQGIDAVFV
jgi:hypothetical protein